LRGEVLVFDDGFEVLVCHGGNYTPNGGEEVKDGSREWYKVMSVKERQ